MNTNEQQQFQQHHKELFFTDEEILSGFASVPGYHDVEKHHDLSKVGIQVFGLSSGASSILRQRIQHQSTLEALDPPTDIIRAASARHVESLSSQKMATLKLNLLKLSDLRRPDQTAKVLTSLERLGYQHQKKDKMEKERCYLQGERFVSVQNLPSSFNDDGSVRGNLNRTSTEEGMENDYYEKVNPCITGRMAGNDDVNDAMEELSQDLMDWESDQERVSRIYDDFDEGAERSRNREENKNNIKSKTLIDSSKAIAKSIIAKCGESINQQDANECEWKERRFISGIGVIGRKHSKLKKRRHSKQRLSWGASNDASDAKNDKQPHEDNRSSSLEMNELKKPRRSALQFMAAPRSVNKRKKQMTLECMFQK